MGFNLKMFFEDLEATLNDPHMSAESKLLILKEYIEYQWQYAREYGEVI